MADPQPRRLKYGTFALGTDSLIGEGVVHLRSELPEVVAIGMDALVEFMRGIPPMGGPHAEMNLDTKRLNIVTPEAEFTYEHIRPESDIQGWYFLFRLIYTSPNYQAFLATRQ